jgi:Beta-lactamase enzyme family
LSKETLRINRVTAGLVLMGAIAGLGALIVLIPADGAPSESATASSRSGGSDAQARAWMLREERRDGPRTMPTATPPPETPAPADAGTGGDQSTGPLPSAHGGIPENVNASPEFLALRDALEGSIAAYADSVGGIDVAIAVTDLQNGQSISVGGNVLHRTGCVINMFALLAAVSEFQAGNASPAGLGALIKKGIGGSYPPDVKNFTQRVFGDYSTGTYRARELMAGWGMSASYFDHIPYYGGDAPGPNILTALETNDILARLWNDQLFNAEWSSYTIGVLRDSFAYVNYIIPGRLPAGAKVAHKIGYYADYDGWVNNDAGIVSFTGADGVQKAYAITYLSQMAGSEKIGYSFGAKLSRDVWDWMVGKYGVFTPPTPVPTPQPTPEPTPPPTPEPTPPPTPEPTPAPTPSPSPAPSASPTKTPKH